MKNDEKIASFLSMTNTEDDDVATQILQHHNWDINESVNAFYSNSFIPKDNSKKRSRLIEEDIEEIDDNVRAPIPPTRTIVSENPSGFADFRPKKKPPSIFSGFMDENSIRNPKRGHLSQIYAPPKDLLCSANFEETKRLGMTEGKWILVNIQDSAEFRCHVLNRDIWSNKDLKDLIKKSFIFWQRFYDDSQGSKYCRFYPQAEIRPHIAIIDPRSGELMKYWKTIESPDHLLTQLTMFLKSHSLMEFTSETSSIIQGEKSKKSLVDCTEDEQLEAAIAASLQETNQKTVTIDSEDSEGVSEEEEEEEDGEEEELDFEPTHISKKRRVENNTSSLIDLSTSSTSIPSTPIEQKRETNLQTTVENSIGIPSEEEEEPNSSLPFDCTIQIRESNGNTLKESFHSFDKLKKVYKFIAKNRTDGAQSFSLMTAFPKRVFSPNELEKTLKELDLVPRAVLIVALS